MRGILSRGKRGDPVAAEYAVVPGWRPISTPAPWQQVGRYGDQYLSQYPAYYNQPQLHAGVEGLRSHYYTPGKGIIPGSVPLPDFLRTQRPNNVFGGQLFGQTYTGPVGPLTAQAFSARVAQAQVMQSGASAMSWASSLPGG